MIVPRRALLSAFAACVCGLSVLLGAYAAHAATGPAQQRLALAALFAFAHGLALIALDGHGGRTVSTVKYAFALGIVFFSGSLAAAALAGAATSLAPIGGMLLIAGWLALAVDFWRKD
jgi:uncharacterized membrane protein YgdD (TMEM256/DUF423 family)